MKVVDSRWEGVGSGPAPWLARVAVLALALPLAVGCARAEPPPGTHPDTRPPEVESIVPGRGAVVPGFDDEARLRFDEPIRVGPELQRELVASPAHRYRVTSRFSEIRIRPEDGWQDGVVYCFELPAGIPDLLGNRTDAPIEFCFSTGPPVTETGVSGRLLDRITGQPIAEGGRILFYPAGDTVPYSAVPRREGEFRLRSLPPGEYRAYGFVDRNRNLRLDRRLEPYDSAAFVLEGPEDAETLVLRAVEPDTVPPVLTGARSVDSLHLRLEFDDHLPVEQPTASVVVTDTLTGRRWPVESFWVGEREEAGPPRGPDPLEPPEDEPAEALSPEDEPAEPLPPEDEPTRQDGGLAREGVTAERGRPATDALPSRSVTVRLAEPLARGAYRVDARGFQNLRLLEGGGERIVSHPPPEGPPLRPQGGPR